jgi:hypothetical protein
MFKGNFMKKLMSAFVVFAALSGAVSAIDLLQYPPTVEGGDFIIDLGAGFSAPYGVSGGFSLRVPPVFATVEYALPIKLPISVGGTFVFWQYGWGGNVYTQAVVAARGNWHWAFNLDWLDFYTGITMGYLYSSGNYLPFVVSSQAGAHFYFTNRVGVMVEAELGYLVSAKAGLALKF